jgi:heptosyltransferase-2/heptosyltransferase-3
MGDMVLVTPIVRALHRRFGWPVDIVSSGPWVRPLLEGQEGVGRIFLLDSRRRPYFMSPDQWTLVAALRERGVGPVWMCDITEQTHALLARAGLGPACQVAARDHPFESREHVVDRYLRMARQMPAAFAAGAPAPVEVEPRPALRVADASRTDTAAWLQGHGLAGRPLVLLQAGNKRTMRRFGRRQRATNVKYWPEERWARVIDGILGRDPGVAVLLLGVETEKSLNEDVLRRVTRPGAVNVAGEVPIPRLLALQERALGMVSVDTGPAHSAAALDCPLVVLFSTADPDRIAPRSHGAPVEILGGRIESLLGIEPEQVLAGWDRALSRAASRP